MTTKDWLGRNAIGFAQLSEADLESFFDFTLVWSFFESAHCACEASVTKFAGMSLSTGMKTSAPIDAPWQYFRARYFSSEDSASRLNALFPNQKNADKKVIVERVLANEQSTLAEQIEAMLYIVYRLRNNFFHGPKWAYGFSDQRENFSQGTCFLMAVSDALGHRQ